MTTTCQPEGKGKLLTCMLSFLTTSFTCFRPSTYLPDESATSLSQEEVLSRGHYEIDELDLAWLDVVNEKRKFKCTNELL